MYRQIVPIGKAKLHPRLLEHLVTVVHEYDAINCWEVFKTKPNSMRGLCNGLGVSYDDAETALRAVVPPDYVRDIRAICGEISPFDLSF
jgi:hypothetical protein